MLKSELVELDVISSEADDLPKSTIATGLKLEMVNHQTGELVDLTEFVEPVTFEYHETGQFAQLREQHEPAGHTHWVNWDPDGNGDDANDGLSPESPLFSVQEALNRAESESGVLNLIF